MKNKTSIKGNNNKVIQDVNSSNQSNAKSKVSFWTLIVAIIGVLVAIIVGWPQIINFIKTFL